MYKLWSHNLHQRPYPHPLLSQHLILVPERHTRLTRLDPLTGGVLWTAKTDTPWGWLTSTDRSIVYLNQHSTLQSWVRDSGEPLWQRELTPSRRQIFGHLVAASRFILTGGWRGYTALHCLDAHTGAPVWAYPIAHDIARPLVGAWGVVLSHLGRRYAWEVATPSPRPHITILDLVTGVPQTHLELPSDIQLPDAYNDVQVWRTHLIITTRSGRIYTLDPEHERVWTLLGTTTSGMWTWTPTIVHDKLIYQDMNGHVCCYNLSDRKLLWSTLIEHHNGERLPATSLMDGHVIVGSSQGILYIVSPRGEVILHKKVEKRIMTSLIASDNRTIVFGTKGALVAYRVQESIDESAG